MRTDISDDQQATDINNIRTNISDDQQDPYINNIYFVSN